MKTLLVYYSYTGNTRLIANKIKNSLDCDILEIKPKIPYSTDYDMVVNESEDNLQTKSTIELESLGVDLKDYKRVIIGTPVWWYTIAPPIRTFLKENDLSGKEVFVFATNAGYIGSTFKEIKEICSGNIVSNISIKFSEDYTENRLVTSSEDIDKWIDSIKKGGENE